MPNPSICTLSAEPDSVSPDGGAEIRHIMGSSAGQLTHAVCHAGNTSATHLLPELDEAYYVLGGAGEIWRSTPDREAVTALRPGRWVGMPRGTRFQYRANLGTSLVFLLAVMPQWREDLFHTVEESRWRPGVGGGEAPTAESELDDSWLAHDLPYVPSSWAPNGSEIRLIGSLPRGGLAQCVVHPGNTSLPIRHRTVYEIWFVTAGHGELWRSIPDGQESVVRLWPGVGTDIAPGAAFQFRATGAEPLRIVTLTLPRWPGNSEAERLESGRWTATRTGRLLGQ